jgi:UDPglucose 6-dehydrogenase
MKIAIAGIGYVGLSNAMLLSQNHEVIALDIVPEKIEQLNNKIPPIADTEIEDFLANKDLNFPATLDKELAYKRARSEEIKNYTGIDSPYELPDNPELVIDTESESLKESVVRVVDFLKSKEIIN